MRIRLLSLRKRQLSLLSLIKKKKRITLFRVRQRIQMVRVSKLLPL